MMVHRKSFRGSCPMLCTVETKEERILKTPRVELLRVDVFDKLVLCIEQQGIIEGIFRVPGNREEVSILANACRTEACKNIDVTKYNVRTVDGAIKQYLRDHPTKIIPSSRISLLHTAMFEDKYATNTRPESEYILALNAVCQQIPPAHAHILWRLLIVLDKVQKNHEITKMNADNLGLIFSPTLFDTSSNDPAKALQNNQLATDIITLMIRNASIICDKLSGVQSTETFRILGHPPKVTEKEKNLFGLHSSGKTFAKEQNMKLNEKGALYLLNDGILNVSSADGNYSFLLEAPGVFGWENYIGKLKNDSVISPVTIVTCDELDLESLGPLLDIDEKLCMGFNWRIAEFIAEQVRYFRHSKILTPPANGNKIINVESKLKRRTKQSVHSIDIEVNYNNSVNVITCSSSQTVDELISMAMESFSITQGQAQHTFELFLPLGDSNMYQLGHDDPVAAFAGHSKSSLATVYLKNVSLSSTPRNTKETNSQVIRDFTCKYKGKSGSLVITASRLIFKSTSYLSRFSKSVSSVNDIRSVVTDGPTVVIIYKTTTPKKFVFPSEAISQTVHQLIESMKDSSEKKAGKSGKAIEENITPFRAEVIKNYESNSRIDTLPLSEGMVVVITKKSISKKKKDEENEKIQELYFGYSSVSSGWFPLSCVSPLKETVQVQYFLSKGYTLQFTLPTFADWHLITKDSLTEEYKENDCVLEKHDFNNRLYYINKGSCRTESGTILPTGEIFGEEELILGGGSLESIYANESGTEIGILEPQHLIDKFDKFPSVAGRFFKFLCIVIDSHLNL